MFQADSSPGFNLIKPRYRKTTIKGGGGEVSLIDLEKNKGIFRKKKVEEKTVWRGFALFGSERKLFSSPRSVVPLSRRARFLREGHRES